MASEIRVDKINSLSGVGTVTLSPTGVDIAGITTAATLRATTGIVTSLTAGSLTSLGAVSGTTGTFSAAVSGTTGTFTGDVDIADKIVHTGDTNTAIRFPAADTITAETGGSERVRITSTGLFGIGTTPEEIFHVKGPSETVSSRDGVFLQHNTDSDAADTGLPLVWSGRISSGLANYGLASICGRKENSTGGDGASYLQFATCNSAGSLAETLRITSGGDVGIGDNNPSIRLTVVDSGTENLIRLGRSDGNSHGSHTVNIKTSKDFYHNFKMEASSFDLDCYNGSSMINALTIDSAGEVVVNSGDLRFGSSGKGIVLGNTSNADANTLDDYEEGSWTPSIRNEGTTANWNSQTGKYVKIGQQVTVWFNADGGSDPRSGGSSSSLIMTGLPFSQSMFSNPILGIVGANKSSGTGLYSTSGLILNAFGQSGTQVRFGCGGQAINFSISYVAGCLTYTAAT